MKEGFVYVVQFTAHQEHVCSPTMGPSPLKMPRATVFQKALCSVLSDAPW